MTTDEGKRDAEQGDSPPTYDEAQKEAPPTYDETISTRLQKAREESSAALLLGCVIFAGLTMSIPIAMIVLGSMYKEDCRAEPYIPIYLIVCGAFSLLSCLMSMCVCVRRRSQGEDDGDGDDDSSACGMFSCCMGCVSGLVGAFLACWFIAGNVWIYRTHEPEYDDVTAEDYCHRTLYLFAFWLMTSTYIIAGCGCCTAFLCTCCASICGYNKK